MAAAPSVHRAFVSLRNDSFRRLTTMVIQEIEHASVHQSTLAVTHVVTGLRDEFALEIRQQPTCASQGRCRVVDAFVVAEQQQYRDTHRAQFVVRERCGEGTQRLRRNSKMLQAEIHQVQERPGDRSHRENL